ncbi:MAG TPA: hypothetical protein VII45_04005 [Solirubrobacterales bacterium]
MSRLRIFLLFAALAALATAFAACGSSGGSSSENPQSVIKDATLQGIESGNIDLSLSVNVSGDEGGKVDVSLDGPFQSRGNGQLPLFDLNAKANGSVGGNNVNFDGGVELLSDKAYVSYEGTDYEVDPTTFGFVRASIEKAENQSGAQGNSSDVTACQEAATGLKVEDFVDNLTNKGTTDVGDTSTTHVSGDLNAPGAIDALIELVENPACAAQLGAAGPLPSTAELDQAKGQIQSALKTAHVDVYVGDDNIVRRISAELSIEPPASAGSGGPKKVDVSFDLSFENVNEEQSITAPSGAKPLNDLFLKLGINPIELLQATEGGGLGSLLNGVGGETGGSSGGGSTPGVSQGYAECLQSAASAADVQKCAAQAG